MTYDSKFNHQSEKLINPAYLCLIASVVLHLAVLKFGLPSFNSEDNVEKRKVAVIELSPEQQARLPNLSPQLQTPNVPNDLPPIDDNEAAPSFAIPRSLIPGIGDPAQLPAINIPPPPNFNFPDLPPITDITLPPIGNIGDLPLPPEINIDDFKVDPTKIPPPSTQNPTQPAQPNKPTKPESTTTENIDPEPKPNKKPKIKTNLTPKPVAKKQDNSSNRIAKLQQSLAQNDIGTSDEEARKNYVLWLAKVKEIEPKEIVVKGIYPRDACIRRLKGNSIFGVVVDAQGQVVATDLLKGAKYPVFNIQGKEDISTLVLDNKTDQPKPYRVQVQYEYDAEICPSLTLPSIRKAEEKSTPDPQSAPILEPEAQPEPTPVPEAKPEPETQPEPTPVPETKPEPEAKPEPTPVPEVKPEPETKPEPTSVPETEPEPEAKPEATPVPETEPEPLPSLKDRLRDIDLPDRNPLDLKDIPLPERPNFNK